MITRRTHLVVGTVLLILALLCPSYLHAQSRKKQSKQTPILFDEFGAVGYCDLTARLDNFAIQLQNSPKQQGFLLAYAPPGAGERILDSLKNYLVNSRGIDEDRLTTIYGGRNKNLSELNAQLWIAPEGVVGPEPVKFDVKPAQFKGIFYEQQGYDEIAYPGSFDEEGFHMGVVMEGFADVFKHQPQSVTYVVGYNGKTSTPGAWKRIAQNEIEELTRLGFEANRFKIIFGGESEEAKVQVWVQPSVEPPPVKDVGPETLPKTSIEMADFDDRSLGDAKYERAAFNRVLESLRGFPTLRAAIIVRLRQPPTKEELEAEAAIEAQEWPVQMRTNQYGVDEPLEMEEPETPPADVLKLIDKWKSELASSHNIREDRFVVLYSRALPGYSSSLEAWLLPPGENLPDPEKKLKEWEAEEAGSSKESAPVEERTIVKKPIK